MIKLRCRNRENDKYIDGIRDFTVAREAGLAKIGHGMRDLCLRVCRECRKPSRPTGSSDQSESTVPDSAHAYRTTDHAFISCSFFILRYKKLFLFAEAFKNTREFKISIERINLHVSFLSFCKN